MPSARTSGADYSGHHPKIFDTRDKTALWVIAEAQSRAMQVGDSRNDGEAQSAPFDRVCPGAQFVRRIGGEAAFVFQRAADLGEQLVDCNHQRTCLGRDGFAGQGCECS